MISTKKLFILFFSSFLCATTSSWCKDGLQIKGKLRILKPTTLQVNDLNGTLILSCELQPNKEFATEQKLIQPDIYTLRIGKTEEKIYFENHEVNIIYNPQIEMFARFKMKSSFHKTKRII